MHEGERDRERDSKSLGNTWHMFMYMHNTLSCFAYKYTSFERSSLSSCTSWFTGNCEGDPIRFHVTVRGVEPVAMQVRLTSSHSLTVVGEGCWLIAEGTGWREEEE